MVGTWLDDAGRWTCCKRRILKMEGLFEDADLPGTVCVQKKI